MFQYGIYVAYATKIKYAIHSMGKLKYLTESKMLWLYILVFQRREVESEDKLKI